MTSFKKAALAGLFVMLAGTTPSFADVLGQSITFHGSFDNGAEVLGNAFDPTIGTLTGVTMSLIAGYSSQFHPNPGDPSSATVATSAYIASAGATANGPADDETSSGSLSGTSVGGVVTATLVIPDSSLSTFSIGGPDFISGDNFGIAYVDVGSRPAVNIGELENLSFFGTLDISYTYTPVPEPRSFLLLGVGLAGLMALRRRFPIAASA